MLYESFMPCNNAFHIEPPLPLEHLFDFSTFFEISLERSHHVFPTILNPLVHHSSPTLSTCSHLPLHSHPPFYSHPIILYSHLLTYPSHLHFFTLFNPPFPLLHLSPTSSPPLLLLFYSHLLHFYSHLLISHSHLLISSSHLTYPSLSRPHVVPPSASPPPAALAFAIRLPLLPLLPFSPLFLFFSFFLFTFSVCLDGGEQPIFFKSLQHFYIRYGLRHP